MKVISSLENIKEPFAYAVITVGNFDGVHIGHQGLLKEVKKRADKMSGTSIVLTFEPHPLKVLKEKKIPLITPFERKIELIEKLGIDVVICLPFTREFSKVSAREFVEEILLKKIGMKEIVVGYDYTFGHKREGNIDLLKKLGDELGFKVCILGPILVDNMIVSSTRIRNLIMEGELEKVKILLNRYYQVSGEVIAGHDRGGRLLGFPTANLKLVNEVFPKNGVYVVEVIYNNKVYGGVTNIGFKPTFGNDALSVETHILDFDQNIYGKKIKLNFIKRLRNEKKFSSIEALAAQIKRDIEEARKILQN
ncbi:MAG: bifunctional riboflavin kinase/FAD synthetase [Deltaproteobacteria bacterium]|nr:bifunctional riboflavin kinase/FAD synthetase [Deltaproteobacteria bacterium]MDL1972241.1 bifunctional riboflavin kinase/FAD synthetase [Deltaproteobacteria bacterium]